MLQGLVRAVLEGAEGQRARMAFVLSSEQPLPGPSMDTCDTGVM